MITKLLYYYKYFIASAFLFFSNVAWAADCATDGTSPTGDICRPSNFFVDLPGINVRYQNTFGGLFLYLVEIGLGFVGILSIAFLVWGGFQYVTSRGNEEQAQSGKKTISNAIIGLIVVILPYIMVTVLINALKGKV